MTDKAKCWVKFKTAMGIVGVLVSAAVMVLSLMVNHGQDKIHSEIPMCNSTVGESTYYPDEDDQNFRNADCGKKLAIMLFSFFTVQAIVYFLQMVAIYKTSEPKDPNNISKSKRLIRDIWNKGVQVQSTVGTIISITVAAVMGGQIFGSEMLIMVDDLALIAFLLQSGAMIVSWQVATQT